MTVEGAECGIKLKSAGAVEVLMPDLFFKPYDYIDEMNLSFSAVAKSEADITIKYRVSAWLKEFEQNMLVGGSLLGLENSPVVSHSEAESTLTEAEEKTLLNVGA